MDSEELVERLGQLIDKVDNYLTYPQNKFMALPMRLDAVVHGLTEIRQEVFEIYTQLGGADEWADRNG